MPYEEAVAERIRGVISEYPGITEKKMFGGIAFMDRGNMTVGVVRDELMVRCGPEFYEEAIERPHARQMDFTGKPLRGFVFVEPKGFNTERKLQDWIDLSLEFTQTLPSK